MSRQTRLRERARRLSCDHGNYIVDAARVYPTLRDCYHDPMEIALNHWTCPDKPTCTFCMVIPF